MEGVSRGIIYPFKGPSRVRLRPPCKLNGLSDELGEFFWPEKKGGSGLGFKLPIARGYKGDVGLIWGLYTCHIGFRVSQK